MSKMCIEYCLIWATDAQLNQIYGQMMSRIYKFIAWQIQNLKEA